MTSVQEKRATSERSLIACLSFAALPGAIVAGLGSPIGAALIAMVLAAFTPAGENGPREAGLVVATLVSCGGALVAAVVAWVLLPRRDVLLAGVDSHMTAA